MVYTITVHLYANSHPDSVPKLKAKLIEASRVYVNDRETINWFVMQDVHDPRAFTIVERFENEAVRLSVYPCYEISPLTICRAKNTILKTHIGKLLTHMSFHYLRNRWI